MPDKPSSIFCEGCGRDVGASWHTDDPNRRYRCPTCYAKWEKEERVAHVVQRIDKANEAKGHALRAIRTFREREMTDEEKAAQAERDNQDLFGERQ